MNRRSLPLLLLPVLVLTACRSQTAAQPSPAPLEVRTEARRLAAAQLGTLEPQLSAEEHDQVLRLLECLVPLRQARASDGRWELSAEESRLVEELNQFYEGCTSRYLGEPDHWSADEGKIQSLAGYDIEGDGALKATDGEDAYRPLWDLVQALLPEGSLDAFRRFTIFTDGVDEILAYVVPVDEAGTQWELAVDPQDTEDLSSFTETVLHEYSHYLTLNDAQVTYGGTPRFDCYSELGMVCLPESYLNAFYQSFWQDYLDDRLAAPDSSGFYLRHPDDFVTGYAATSPSEDIAESFAFFVLADRAEGDAVWEQKLNFFYAYPELVTFRDQTRAQLGL